MARIPATVRVGPLRYRVVRDAQRLPLDHWGMTDKARQVVALSPDQSEQRTRLTLLHEILHTLADITNLDGIDPGVEERLVTQLAPALLDLLRENPALVSYLTDTD